MFQPRAFLLPVAFSASILAVAMMPGCAGSSSDSLQDPGESRKIKEDAGKKVLQPIEATRGRSSPKKGSGGMDSSL